MASAGRLWFLDLHGRVLSANTDGGDLTVLVDGLLTRPDGIAVDLGRGHVYWTNMGRPRAGDGSLQRCNLDGTSVTTLIPSGTIDTGKQLRLEPASRKLYWADREGMRIQRADLDGSNVEVLIRGEPHQHATAWCVGIALDVERDMMYWTQKGRGSDGKILRAPMSPAVPDPVARADVEVLFDRLPGPVDLDLDLAAGLMYWTDNGTGPRGCSLNRAPIDPPANIDPDERTDTEVLARQLDYPVGLVLDPTSDHIFFTDVGRHPRWLGKLYRARRDGSELAPLATELGALAGITYV